MKKIICLLITAVLLTSCGAKPAATVGKMKITAGEFEWYLDSIKEQMNGTELQTEEDWETQEIEGQKAIDAAKQRAFDNAMQNVLYIEAARSAGIELTDSELEQIKATKNRVISGYGGKKEYKAYLKENNITDDFIEMMCRSKVYYNKIKSMVTAENPVTDEDCRKYFEDNGKSLASEIRKAKHILILTVDQTTRVPLSEEECAQAKKLAEELLTRVKSGEDFDALMHQYSQDPGLEGSPDGYVFGAGEMVTEFEQAVDTAEPGEIAFCESDYGYHIIKRLPLTYEDAKERISEKIVEERIRSQISDWQEEYEIEITRNEKLIADIK